MLLVRPAWMARISERREGMRTVHLPGCSSFPAPQEDRAWSHLAGFLRGQVHTRQLSAPLGGGA